MNLLCSYDPSKGYLYPLKRGEHFSICLNFHWAMSRNGFFGPEIEPILMMNKALDEMLPKEVQIDDRIDICHGWIKSVFSDFFSTEYGKCMQAFER